jgi:hypothetical protein
VHSVKKWKACEGLEAYKNTRQIHYLIRVSVAPDESCCRTCSRRQSYESMEYDFIPEKNRCPTCGKK